MLVLAIMNDGAPGQPGTRNSDHWLAEAFVVEEPGP